MIPQRKRIIIYIIVGVIIATLWWITKSKPLPVFGSIPQFEMTNSKGEPFGTDNLTGNI